MAIKVTALGSGNGAGMRVVARVVRQLDSESANKDFALVVDDGESLPVDGLSAYSAVVCGGTLPAQVKHDPSIVAVDKIGDTSFLWNDQVILADPAKGFLRVLYRPGSRANTIFITEQCDNNCLMCSQPPKDIDDSYLVAENLRLIDLIPGAPPSIGITGGEPTLLGEGLLQILRRLRSRFPASHVHMLTNGRRYSDIDFAFQVADVGHPELVSGIPLYGDVADIHDYVVQAKGAFDQTLEGLYNAHEAGLRIEVRYVLHKQTIPRIREFAEFLYRHAPFVEHVALMGLENMGYVRKNWDDLWIDPIDYQRELEAAVRDLHHRQMTVSIYNLPLCVVPRSLWSFARQSISDFKNIYLEPCGSCDAQAHCAGLFSSGEKLHSRAIQAITI